MKVTRALAFLVLFLTFVFWPFLGWQANSFMAQDAGLDRGVKRSELFLMQRRDLLQKRATFFG